MLPQELIENKLLSPIYNTEDNDTVKWNIISSTLDRIVIVVDDTYIVGIKFDSDKLKIAYVVDLTPFVEVGRKLTENRLYSYVDGKVQLGLIFILFQYGCICILSI